MNKKLVMIKMYLMTNHRKENAVSISNKNGKDAKGSCWIASCFMDLSLLNLLNMS